MDFSFIPNQREVSKILQSKADLVKAFTERTLSLEELVLKLIESNFVIRIMDPKDGREVLPLAIIDQQIGSAENLVGMIFISKSELLKKYKPKFIPTKVSRSPKTREFECDDKWFSDRDNRLRVRKTSNPWREVYMAPPTSLVELVLSYALVPMGMVEISSEMERGNDNYPRDCVKLDLRCLIKSRQGYFYETFFIRLDKLTQLIERRRAKVELSSLSPSALN